MHVPCRWSHLHRTCWWGTARSDFVDVPLVGVDLRVRGNDALVCRVLRGALDYACGVGAAEPPSSLPDDCSAPSAESPLAQLGERRAARELVRRWVLSRRLVVERLLLATTVEFPRPADVLPVWTPGPPLPDSASSVAW